MAFISRVLSHDSRMTVLIAFRRLRLCHSVPCRRHGDMETRRHGDTEGVEAGAHAGAETTQPTCEEEEGEGGPMGRCAGSRHTSCVETRSRGFAGRTDSRWEITTEFSPAVFRRKRINTDCAIGAAPGTGLAVAKSAWIIEQQGVLLLSRLFLPLWPCSWDATPA